MTIRFSEPAASYQAHKSSIDAAMRRVLDSGRYLSGVETEAFESEFASFVGVPHGVAVGNGTDALELALRACGIGPGDEVISVSHTAVATVCAIERTGANAVLVDVDPATYTMNPALLTDALTERTKAIVPVHLYGQPADMVPILAFAKEAGLQVVEDCAQAHGAAWNGKPVGSLGDAASFSFYPTKNLGALGDGGMVVTRDDSIAGTVRQLREYGWNAERESVVAGGNSRMDELQAAVLRDKLTRLTADIARRVAIAGEYNAQLADTPLILPQVREGCGHAYHLYVVQCAERDALLRHLVDDDIVAGVHYKSPVHAQPAFSGRLRLSASMAVTERLAECVLSLPIYPEITEEQVQRVVEVVSAF